MLPSPSLPPGLALRVINQAPTGELILTADEAATLLDYVILHPGAAVMIGPGRIVPIISLPVNVLPNL